MHSLSINYPQEKEPGLTGGAAVHAVDAQGRILVGQLAGLDLRQGRHRRHAAVLGQRQGDGLEGVGEGPEGVLLERADLVGAGRAGQGAGYLGGAAAVHDPVVDHEVAHRAEGVVDRALGLLHDLEVFRERRERLGRDTEEFAVLLGDFEEGNFCLETLMIFMCNDENQCKSTCKSSSRSVEIFLRTNCRCYVGGNGRFFIYWPRKSRINENYMKILSY